MHYKKYLLLLTMSAMLSVSSFGCSNTNPSDNIETENRLENIEKNEYAIEDEDDGISADEKNLDENSEEYSQESDDKKLTVSDTSNSDKQDVNDDKKTTSIVPDSSMKETQSEQKTESSTLPNDSQNQGTDTGFTKPIVSETKPAVSYKPIEGTQDKEVVTLVETVKEITEGDKVPYKYGVTKQEVVTNYYDVYSDGTKTLSDTMTYTAYDASGYHATDAELQPESDKNASSYQSYYQEVLRLVNQIRADAGVEPVVLDNTLCRAASMRAVEMDYADAFSHTRPNGSKCFTVFSHYQIGYGTAGENIGYGYVSPSRVVDGWKNSPGHYENLVNPHFRKMGVGYSNVGVTSGGNLWAQLFTD